MKKAVKLLTLILAVSMLLASLGIISYAAATPIEAGNSMANATNIPGYGTDYVSSLSKSGEVDWFKFTTLADDAYYTLTCENYSIPEGTYLGQNLRIYLYDGNMRLLGEKSIAITKSAKINLKLENMNTYFIKACHEDSSKSSNIGNYAISIEYVYDNVPNSINEAKEIAVNTTQNSSLDGMSDADWFKLAITESGRYKLSCTNHNITEGHYRGEYLYIYLFDVYEHTLLDFEITTNNTVVKEVDLEAGNIYYVKLIHEGEDRTGNYSFSLTLNGYTPIVPPTDPDIPASKTLTSISVASMPDKTDYLVGETLVTDGLKITANYSNGTSAYVNGYTISADNFSTEGEKTVIVSYTENGVTKTCTFEVNVLAEGSDVNGFINFFMSIWNFFVNIFNAILDIFAML